MKILVASDIHGSAYWGRALIEAFQREGADRLLLLGDLLYHGPRNPLPRDYAPMEVAAMLNAHRDRILAVRGNCEAEVDQMVLDFPVMGDSCLLSLGKRTVFATHGHLWHKQALPPMQPGDILLHGHTHVPAWEDIGQGRLYLNPGSVSMPKDGTPHSYLLLTEGEAVWKELEGSVFHTFKI